MRDAVVKTRSVIMCFARWNTPPRSKEQTLKRLLFISHGPLLYGAQHSLLALLSGIDREQITPILLSPRKGPLTEAAENLGIQVVISDIEHWVAFGQAQKHSYARRLYMVTRGLMGRVRAIARIVAELDIDLVYTNTVTVIEGSLAARITRRPHVWHLREHIAGNQDLSALLPVSAISRIVAALSDRVIVNSHALARAYFCRNITNKLAVVHNGIDVIPYLRSVEVRQEIRKEFRLGPDTSVVATIGSITPRKGHRLFIEAASRLAKMRSNVTFLVVGDGNRRLVDELTSRVCDLGLEHAFRFIGWRNDITRIMSAIDLLIVSAEQEAFGRTIIEAMAAKLPVVATKCGGPEEIVVDGVTGFLVPLDNPDALAIAAAKILGDDELAIRMGNAGYARAAEMFSVDAYVKNIESVISNLTR